MKNKIWYFCRHCGKKYHSAIEANLCFDLDMKELKSIKKLKNGINNSKINNV